MDIKYFDEFEKLNTTKERNINSFSFFRKKIDYTINMPNNKIYYIKLIGVFFYEKYYYCSVHVYR